MENWTKDWTRHFMETGRSQLEYPGPPKGGHEENGPIQQEWAPGKRFGQN